MKRPRALTNVGSLLVVLGTISLLLVLVMPFVPLPARSATGALLPHRVTQVLEGISALVNVVAGVAILRGCDWGRKLYVAVALAGLAIGLANGPTVVAVIPAAVVVLAFTFFLFRSEASTYFHRSAERGDGGLT